MKEEDVPKRFAGKEHVLNHTALRFHLTRPKAVGPVMEMIRICQPKTYDEWEAFYWEKAVTKTKEPVKITREVIAELGTRLYEKIQGVVIPEWTKAFETITLEDCIDYVLDVTLKRTYSGFQREKSAVYDNLAHIFPEIEFKESDADLDHSGDVDFIGVVARKNISIGIQIKPITGSIAYSGFLPSDRMKKNFASFKEKYGGSVFIVFSEKEVIVNKDIIEKIRAEIA
jgi:hypothetical protein